MENYLISCCAATLAGKKAANVFSLRKEKCPFLNLDYWNENLKPYGIKIKVLREDHSMRLIYVYREDFLKEILSKKDVKIFLQKCGYVCTDFVEMLENLSKRLNEYEEFPHEIGIFLGYPLCDVEGFIKNKGRRYKKCGLWKVYNDVNESEKKFCEYKSCRNYFMAMHEKGYDLLDIIKKYKGGYDEKSCDSLLVGNGQY